MKNYARPRPTRPEALNVQPLRCRCGHWRDEHGRTYSSNYTAGLCKNCQCLAFVMERA